MPTEHKNTFLIILDFFSQETPAMCISFERAQFSKQKCQVLFSKGPTWAQRGPTKNLDPIGGPYDFFQNFHRPSPWPLLKSGLRNLPANPK